MVTFFLIFLMAAHILACLWIFIAVLHELDEGKNTFSDTWLEPYKEQGKDKSDLEVYVISLYWVITTLSTVGFGDISGNNVSERIYCILLMMAGTVWFSYINGTIFSLL